MVDLSSSLRKRLSEGSSNSPLHCERPVLASESDADVQNPHRTFAKP